MLSDDLKNTLYSDDFKRKLSTRTSANFLAPFFNNFGRLDLLDLLLKTDVSTNLPNDLLAKVDIAGMANSLECRSPFLDQKVMEFAAKLPAEYKMKNLVKKYILKKAIKNIVPQKNIYRPKMGFGVPVGHWFRNELKGFLADNLLSEKSFRRGYFKPEAIKKIVCLHTEGKADYSFCLWTLLMLELWYQKFID
jgi:asparagine synthase (glutamine-hydrolysing)